MRGREARAEIHAVAAAESCVLPDVATGDTIQTRDSVTCLVRAWTGTGARSNVAHGDI